MPAIEVRRRESECYDVLIIDLSPLLLPPLWIAHSLQPYTHAALIMSATAASCCRPESSKSRSFAASWPHLITHKMKDRRNPPGGGNRRQHGLTESSIYKTAVAERADH
jgi:hypothetical protein